MYIALYKDNSGVVQFNEFTSENEALGFALQKKGYVLNANKPEGEIK